jgi:hypothetical protein
MLSKTDSKLIVLHRLSHYTTPLGVANEPWHQKLFALTGDVVGSQMPQTAQVPLRALDILPQPVKIAKLAAQLTSLLNNTVLTLGPVATGANASQFDEMETQFMMYVPGKYLPLLIACRMTPKEALMAINAEAVVQNEQDTLAPLIEWLRVAVTRSAVEPNMHSPVTRSAPPTMPIMEPTFAEKQRTMVEGDLPNWNRTNTTGGGTPGLPGHQPGGTPGSTATTILQSLQLLIQQSQTQGTITPARPSEHWEGTIDLLLRLVGVGAEDNLPPIWLAWANYNKKEARNGITREI